MDSATKNRARAKVQYAVKVGRLIRQPCEVCGVSETEAHHEDYDKPLEVVWLCYDCHDTRHREERAERMRRLHASGRLERRRKECPTEEPQFEGEGMTTRQVAKHSRYPYVTVLRYVSEGFIQGYMRPNGRWVIPKPEADRLRAMGEKYE